MKQKWIQMPHPGHFIGSNNCRFFRNTYVNGYIVSTVGEYAPAITFCKNKQGFMEIGLNRLYETMVFKAKKAPADVKCCAYVMAEGLEIDMQGYNTAKEATAGHLDMCKKYDRKQRMVKG